jgi:aldehyde:ferredoxin oxidoreductase
MFGYAGKMLFVNLTTGELEDKVIPEEWYRDFIGGPALGARILYEYMPAKCDVYGEDSMVGFVSGPLNGSNFFCGGRYSVVSKSPVYNGWNDANSGGNFGPSIKAAGYDGVFVKGISPKPVYIFIDSGKAELRDAAKYWGMESSAFEKALEVDLGVKYSASYIGPGGEMRSPMACVMNDYHRAAGRGGTGAVIGSKKLKGVVAVGRLPVELADKGSLVELNKKLADFLKDHPMMANMRSSGSSGAFMPNLMSGDTCVKNYSVSLEETGKTPDDFSRIGAPKLSAEYMTEGYSCVSCPMRCGAMVKIGEGKYKTDDEVPVARPEYESLGWFGPGIMNEDPEAVIVCNHLCNEYGLDTISTGGTLGWVYECFNKGVLTKEELDGIEPFWGSGDAAVALTEKICRQEGVGKILAQGSRSAADRFGKGHEFLFVASGIEIAAHDPRRAPGYIRTYQLDPSPGRHVKGGLAKANDRMTKELRYNYRVTGYHDVQEMSVTEYINASGLCIFTARVFPGNAIYDAYKYTTGWDMTMRDLRFFGMRSFTIRWAFNLREGFRRDDFTVTDRMSGRPPLAGGPTKGVTLDETRLGDNFYNALGYYQDGTPYLDMLQLTGGLDCVIRELYPPAPKS